MRGLGVLGGVGGLTGPARTARVDSWRVGGGQERETANSFAALRMTIQKDQVVAEVVSAPSNPLTSHKAAP